MPLPKLEITDTEYGKSGLYAVTEFQSGPPFTKTGRIAQSGAHHICLRFLPAITTDRVPCVVGAVLYSSLLHIIATHQTNGTFLTSGAYRKTAQYTSHVEYMCQTLLQTILTRAYHCCPFTDVTVENANSSVATFTQHVLITIAGHLIQVNEYITSTTNILTYSIRS